MKFRAGITKGGFLPLLSALFLLGLHPSQAAEYTRALGTIYCDGGIRGTASHISLPKNYQHSQSVILTAAHVMFNQHSGKPYKQCAYLPHNKRLSGIAFETLSVHNYPIESSDKIAQASRDIVFVKLKHRVHQPTLSLAKNASTNAENLLLLSISHKDNANFESWECQQLHYQNFPQDQILLHNCPSKAGDSGAPILDSNKGTIVAIHGGRLNLGVKDQQLKSNIWVKQARRTGHSINKILEDFLRQP